MTSRPDRAARRRRASCACQQTKMCTLCPIISLSISLSVSLHLVGTLEVHILPLCQTPDICWLRALGAHLELQVDVDGAIEAARPARAHAVLVHRRCTLLLCGVYARPGQAISMHVAEDNKAADQSTSGLAGGLEVPFQHVRWSSR